jgi:hypothetical protein
MVKETTRTDSRPTSPVQKKLKTEVANVDAKTNGASVVNGKENGKGKNNNSSFLPSYLNFNRIMNDMKIT